MANSKLIESFRAKIKGIFKESAELEDPLDQRPGPDGKPTMPPKPVSKPPVLEADEAPIAPVAPPTEGAPEVDPAAPPVEEEKVTLTVSLLKSLLDWAHGEEEGEGEAEEGEAGAEVAPEAAPAPAAPVTEEEAPVDPAAPAVDPAAPPVDGAEGEGLEDAGVEAIEIQALVDKVKELAATKGELTDEDFGEIVAAAEAAEGEGEAGAEDLSGIMGDEGGAEAPAPTEPVTENIGEIIPKGAKFKNEGNKGIGK